MELERSPLLERHPEVPVGFDRAVELFRAAQVRVELDDGPLTERVMRAYTCFRPVKEEQLPVELREEFLTLWETFQRAGQLGGTATDRLQQTVGVRPDALAERIVDLAERLQVRQREVRSADLSVTE